MCASLKKHLEWTFYGTLLGGCLGKIYLAHCFCETVRKKRWNIGEGAMHQTGILKNFKKWPEPY